MLRLKYLLTICALLLLYSCGPFTKIGYRYTPPETDKGKQCAAKCNIQKQKCEQQAERDYQKCLADNRKEAKLNTASGKNNTGFSFGPNCQRYNCIPDYNNCLTICGGGVEEYTYQEDGLF